MTLPTWRTVVDADGVAWVVTEAYEEAGGQKTSILWFETGGGRTASARVPTGSLTTMTDQELLALLREGTDRRGRQP